MTTTRNPPNHASIFAALKAKSLDAKRAQRIPVVRAKMKVAYDPIRDESRTTADVFKELKSFRGDDSSTNKKKDLRELITKLKNESSLREDDDDFTTSDDSYRSTSSSHCLSSRPPSLALAKDLVLSIADEQLSPKDKHKVVDQLLALPIKSDGKLAEAVVISEKSFNIFQICSQLLSSPDKLLLFKYLQFLGRVLKHLEASPNSRIHNVISTKMNEFNLYQELVMMMDCPDYDTALLNDIAKILYLTTSRSKVFDLCQLEGFRPKNFINSMQKLNTKYTSLLSVSFVRFVYDFKHDLDKTVNDSNQDMHYCKFLTEVLRKDPSLEHAILGLYFILNRMPMEQLIIIFSSQGLGDLLDKVIEAHETDGNEEAQIAAFKIKQFPLVGNFISEKIKRNSVMKLERFQDRKSQTFCEN